jgi:hypothetical protein
MADALGQTAMQAPQPMHDAASIERSAASFWTGIAFTGADRNVASGLDDPVQRRPIDNQVTDDGERLGAPRLDPDLIAVAVLSHVELTGGRTRPGAMGLTIDHHTTGAANPLAAIVVDRDGLLPTLDEALVEHVQHLEKRHVRTHVAGLVPGEPAFVFRAVLPPDVQREVHYL